MLSVLIPVFNERPTIAEILRRVAAVDISKEIIVVDDGSDDGTREYLQQLVRREHELGDLRLLLHPRNLGKGAAIRTALHSVGGDILLIQDADLEYDPRDYPRLLAPVLEGKADVVYGSRFTGSEAHRVLFFWHMVGNRFLTLLSNMFTNLNLTDMETCYKLFRADVLRRIEIEEQRFGFEPEVTAKAARLGLRIYEVGIGYSGRTYGEGKKIGWKDGVRALYCILKYGLLRR